MSAPGAASAASEKALPTGRSKNLCKQWPSCKFDDACLFAHPLIGPAPPPPGPPPGESPCRFAEKCTRPDCYFWHPPSASSLAAAAAAAPPSEEMLMLATSTALHRLIVPARGLFDKDKECDLLVWVNAVRGESQWAHWSQQDALALAGFTAPFPAIVKALSTAAAAAPGAAAALAAGDDVLQTSPSSLAAKVGVTLRLVKSNNKVRVRLIDAPDSPLTAQPKPAPAAAAASSNNNNTVGGAGAGYQVKRRRHEMTAEERAARGPFRLVVVPFLRHSATNFGDGEGTMVGGDNVPVSAAAGVPYVGSLQPPPSVQLETVVGGVLPPPGQQRTNLLLFGEGQSGQVPRGHFEPFTVESEPLAGTMRGHRMLCKMGWEPETGLGSTREGAKEPVKLVVRPERSGLGASAPKHPQSY